MRRIASLQRHRRCWTLLVALALAIGVAVQAQEMGPINPARGPDLVTSVRRVASTVVTIATTGGARTAELGYSPDSFALPMQRGTAPGDDRRERRGDQDRGLASGVVIGSDGQILTNAHAVADVDRAIVRLADGRQFVGTIVGLDRTTDLALIRIAARDLPAAAIGDSTLLAAGEWVGAIGAPFGLDRSVTVGVVSAPRRLLPGSAVPLIQSDVAINPGSSGGPLFNQRGEVVGINSMIFSRSGGYMGVSFSIPMDVALKVSRELNSAGHVSRGQLGAKIQEVTPELARAFGLPAPLGALVLRVLPGTPAARAGLRSGDILTGIDDSADASYNRLQQDVVAARPGQRLVLNVWRRGAMQRVTVVVAEAPADLPARAEPAAPGDERLGLNLAELSDARRARLGIEGGLAVLEAHGVAARDGIQTDDVVVAVGDRPVRALAEFDAALAAQPAGRPLALLILRDRSMAYVAVDARR